MRLRPQQQTCVIGGGLTGLCLGALLAKQGTKVTVLEAHPTLLGGHARTLVVEGFRFCAGPQYVWGFRPEGIGQRVLAHLGLAEAVPFDSMDARGFEQVLIGDRPAFPVPMGLDAYRAALKDRFPRSATAIDRLFTLLAGVARAGVALFDRGAYLGGKKQVLATVLGNRSASWTDRFRTLWRAGWTLRNYFDAAGMPEEVRRVIYAHGGIFLENEADVSGAAFAIGTWLYHQGADFPRHGFSSLVDSLAQSIRRNGGRVAVDKEVAGLVVRGGRIVRIRCRDGEEVPSDFLVSNIAPASFARLAGAEGCCTSAYTPSHGVLSLFLGVSGCGGLKARLDGRNLWWHDGAGSAEYREPDMRRPPRSVCVASPSSNGAGNLNASPQDHSLLVFSPGNYKQVMEIRAAGRSCYEDFLAGKTAEMLDRLEAVGFPGLRRHVRFARLLTPPETECELHAESGGAYGRRLTPQSLMRAPVRRIGVENLCFACATTGLPGVASAFRTAASLVERLTGEAHLIRSATWRACPG